MARLAANHLTPAARTRLSRIFNTTDSTPAVADALALASTWADETKTETKTGAWHYIDLTLEDSRKNIPERCPYENCAPVRIRQLAAQLQSEVKSHTLSELDALRYVVHLVGDIHQPLHTISDADLGGNCELLTQPVQQAKNLHALWDGGIIAVMNPDDRALARELDSEISEAGKGHWEKIVRGTVDDWTWESHELAEKVIYRRLHIPTEPAIFPRDCQDAPAEITNFHPHIDGVYIDDMKPIIRLQLIKAGLRLAHLLNESL